MPRARLGRSAKRIIRTEFIGEEDEGPIDARSVSGEEEAEEKVTAYLEFLHENEEIEGDIEIRLSQLGTGAKSAVATFKFKQDDSAPELASDIVSSAIDDVLAVGRGKIKYEIRGIVAGAPMAEREGFTLKTEEPDEDDVDDLPNERGLVTQLMRHMEQDKRLFRDLVQTTVASLRGQNAELSAELRDVRKNDLEQRKIFGEMMHQKHALDIDVRRFEKQEERKDGVFKQIADNVGILVPVAMQKFLGVGTTTPVAPTVAIAPVERLVQGFFNEMTEERMGAVFARLPPEKQATFHGLVAMCLDRDERRKKGEPLPDQTKELLDFVEALAAGWDEAALNDFTTIITLNQRWALFELIKFAREREVDRGVTRGQQASPAAAE